MPSRDRIRLAALTLVALLLAAPSNAAPASDADREVARATVQETVDAVLGILRDGSLSSQEKQDRIRDIAYARFDFQTISKLVLARNWQRLSPQQRADFEAEFKRHLSVTYGSSVDRYANQSVEITDTRAEGNGDVTVRTRILGNGQPFLVDYRLRSNSADWYVIDVIVENVSLLSNFRSQTQEIISHEGPDGLIRKLREKNSEREAESS